MRARVPAGALALAVLAAAPASAAAQNVVHSSAFTFIPPTVAIGTGETLTHTTADAGAHNVVAVDEDAEGRPLFSSGSPQLVGAADVQGVPALVPGSYEFFCSIHGNMRGTLRVEDRAGPQPPPVGPPDPNGAPSPLELLPPLSPRPLAGDSWPMYGHDLSNSRNGGALNSPAPTEAARLGPVWVLRSDDGDFTGTPVIGPDGTLVMGSSGGTVYALDASTGSVKWTHDFDKPINASASISGDRVYVPLVVPGSPSVAALDLATGDVLWETVTTTQPTADSYGSPTVWDGKVFIGTSGYFGEQLSEVDVQARGKVVALDAATGQIVWELFTVPEGHDGGAVWSTAAVDPAESAIFVGTGNAYHAPVAGHTDSMLKLDADTGRVLSSWQSVANDAWNGAEDSLQNPDADFGASANLFEIAGRKVVGQGEKNGSYYVRDRGDLSTGVWSTLTGPGSFMGGIIGSTAIDGSRVYGPDTQGGEVWALNRANGAHAWVSSDGGPLHFGAVSVANGVVYSNDTTGFLTARDTLTGAILTRVPLGAPAWGGVAIAGGYVFTATGTGGTAGYIVGLRPR